MPYYLVTAMLGLLIFTGAYASDYEFGQLALPRLFSDHMVLQRGQSICVWGKAAPFEKVQVQLHDDVAKGMADFKGDWTVNLPARSAGGPYDLVVKGKHTIVIKDVLVGDVWLCAGQSNMMRTVSQCEFTPAQIQYANFSQVRHYVRHTTSLPELREIPEEWRQADAQNVTNFSAVGYFFSSELQAHAGVPIGVIECAVGGTPIKTWVSNGSLKKHGKIPGLPLWSYGQFYDELIEPVSHSHIKGVVWYQGESDVFGACEYAKLLRLLIKDWRAAFGQPQLPFLCVQLPNFGKSKSEPGDSMWAELREAQQQCMGAPNIYMTVNIDTAHSGDEGADLHPTTKIEVGHRLAHLALRECYGGKGLQISPTYESMRLEGNAIRLHFRRAENGIVCHGQSIKGFAIAGADQKFHWAEAQLLPSGADVKVWSVLVPHPVAVRYAWADNPQCNLYSFEGLPVAPFRTDTWHAGVVLSKS